MLTRKELEREYMVDVDGTIANPGKFEGEPLYVPYYWDMHLSGMADSDNGKRLTFVVSEEDRKQFPMLTNVRCVELWESEYGFIMSDKIGMDCKPMWA